MPRKLLRVALVAAVIPALTPEISSAQTGRTAAPVGPAASAPAPAQKTGIAGWWQKVRGVKPAPAPTTPTSKIVRTPTTPVPASRTPTGRIVRVSGEQQVTPAKPSPEAAFQFEDSERAPITTQPRVSTTIQRGRPGIPAIPVQQQVVAPPVPVTSAPVATETPVAPVPPVNDADAFPIEGAAPPVNSNLNAQGPAGVNVPAPAPSSDVSFAKPAVPTAPYFNGQYGYGTPPVAAPVAPGTFVAPGPVGYARLDGAMYPSPQPGIPSYVGSVMITNPALDPHEMLYAHSYRGLYGPFYHKTYRHWVLTPFGMCKSEKRVLVGTEVRVNYKSHISPFALFWPPVTN